MKILVLVAGTNDPSNADRMADAFIEGMKKAEGAEIEKIRLKDLSIDHFTLEHYNPSFVANDDFKRIEEAMRDAKGLVIATPIWNFSVPAHLKNVVDRMGSFALDAQGRSLGQLKKLPVFFIFTGGAPVIAWRALMYLTTLHLPEAFKYYGATIMGKHFEAKCTLGRGKFGLVVDQRPQSLEQMRREGLRFAGAAKHYAEQGTLPIGSRIRQQFFSLLYRVGNRIMYPISSQQ